MPEDFLPPVDVEQRARRCIRENNLRIAYERITALVELVNALRVKCIKNYRDGAGMDGDLIEILKGINDPSNRRPQLAIVRVTWPPATSKLPALSLRSWFSARSPQPARSRRLC